MVRDNADGYYIDDSPAAKFPDDSQRAGQQLYFQVVEVGSDYIVVRDIAEITDTLVPIYSIKSIVKVKTKAQ